MSQFIDSHCHIHWPDYKIDQQTALKNAKDAGLKGVICVGTDFKDSQSAVEFAQKNQNVWASVGLHPHDAKLGSAELDKISSLMSKPKVIAIGECGLDYYYTKSPKNDQTKILKKQIEMALTARLPIIFHVRDAYDDFWPVFDSFKGIRGVMHSFTAGQKELDQILQRGLYVGLNGIITFSKQLSQLEAAKAIPLDKLLIETDAPFLSPIPLRGQINQPANVVYTAQFLSELRGEPIDDLATTTTANANQLFNI